MTNLRIITNRKLCKNLPKRLEEVLYLYKKGDYLSSFTIEGVVLREKDLSREEYASLLREVMKVCKYYGVDIILHRNWKEGIDFGINKIQLPLNDIKSICCNEYNKEVFFKYYKDISVSVHSVNEAKIAYSLGATSVVAGHIFNTECKKGLEPRGLSFLNDVCESIEIPVYAIGGIDEEKSKLAILNGAKGVCMMSEIMK
ncbi:thiamine phosphate synthase [Peptostreptococcus faecalis]|uniref:thiamine phosphate synthase n=1 Tax=Peptostreptococcus faecalis TaxID=2045015 RepID=UPI000C7BCC02|nr:thiamine phosphate synthase [Peptostreptococcus faecalis]